MTRFDSIAELYLMKTSIILTSRGKRNVLDKFLLTMYWLLYDQNCYKILESDWLSVGPIKARIGHARAVGHI